MSSHSHTSSGSSTGRHSRGSSKHLSSISDKSRERDSYRSSNSSQHSRSRSKITSAPGRPRGESANLENVSVLHHDPNAIDRPQTKSRALSAPLMPNGTLSTTSITHGLQYGGATAGHGDVGDEEIANDPFFQRYSLPPYEEEDDDADSDRIESMMSQTGSGSSQSRPESIVDPLASPTSPQSPRYWNASQAPKPQLQEVNIAVIGSTGVGKSTFIRNAVDLEDLPRSAFISRKVQMDGTVYVVRLIEMSYGDLDLDEERCMCWPDIIQNTPVPHIDGAFTLYDITAKDSLIQVPETLGGLYNAQIPFLLVACKCDHSPNLAPVDPDEVDADARAHIGDIRTLKTSELSPDTQKRCVAVLLRAIAAVRTQQLNNAPNRRRANSSAVQQNAVPSPTMQKHHRANSEMSVNMSMANQRTRFRPEINPPLTTKSKSHQQLTSSKTSRGSSEDGHSHDSADRNGEGLEMNLKKSKSANKNPQGGVSFEDLVSQLLSQPRQKSDSQFTNIFLALYRMFASPSQLLDAIIHSFEGLGPQSIPTMIKTTAQQRHLNVLDMWTSYYPGDFAHPYSNLKLRSFVTKLASIPLFAGAAQELGGNLEAVLEDDDTDWEFCDRRERSNPAHTGSLNLITKDLSGLTLQDKSSGQTPISPLTLGSSQMSSTQSLLSFVDQATRQAVYLTPQAKHALTKLQWHLLIDLPEDLIAREMTRMDWTMFCSIRPRDLVRYVTLNAEQKSACRSLENVQRMIDHFNHVAMWTVNFILLRDKPKHRAFMLEKMMKIARELRRMNNYNALGAVVAGINNAAVQRLRATKDMIDPSIGKDFLKLDILMNSQKSYGAYRLAWDNTSLERIPYLPLHKRDLVTAADGNKTFIGEESDAKIAQKTMLRDRRINWQKFKIMGGVVDSLQRAKDVPYPALIRSDEVKTLLIDVEIQKDEDKLYERSKQVESSTGDSKERRFGWRKG